MILAYINNISFGAIAEGLSRAKMPKGKKVSLVDQRAWLERYERGETLNSIALAAKRSVRAVWEHIGKAREEREGSLIRAERMKQAYELHNADLLRIAQSIGERASTFEGPGLFVAADRADKLLVDALRAHTSRSPIWTWSAIWEERAQTLEHIGSTIQRWIGQEHKGSVTINASGFSASVLQLLQNLATGIESPESWYREQETKGGWELRWGAYLLASGVNSHSELMEIRSRHDALRRGPRLFDRNLGDAYVLAFREWLETQEEIEQEVQRMVLRRMVPGECDLCPGAAPRTATKRPRQNKAASS
jgi:hypothetical protein